MANEMSDKDRFVNSFLGWKLPQDFHPDAGITFTPEYNVAWGKPPERHEPIGTNLFTADQAGQMFDQIIKPLLDAKQAQIDRLMLEYCPEEMTEAQTAEWAKHQRAVPECGTPMTKLENDLFVEQWDRLTAALGMRHRENVIDVTDEALRRIALTPGERSGSPGEQVSTDARVGPARASSEAGKDEWNAALDAALNCYSPDDTAMAWSLKINFLKRSSATSEGADK